MEFSKFNEFKSFIKKHNLKPSKKISKGIFEYKGNGNLIFVIASDIINGAVLSNNINELIEFRNKLFKYGKMESSEHDVSLSIGTKIAWDHLSKNINYYQNENKNQKITFERGKISRAKRDVLARHLPKKKIKSPYALATYMIKKGNKPKGKKKEIVKEFKEQKAMKNSIPKKEWFTGKIRKIYDSPQYRKNAKTFFVKINDIEEIESIIFPEKYDKGLKEGMTVGFTKYFKADGSFLIDELRKIKKNKKSEKKNPYTETKIKYKGYTVIVYKGKKEFEAEARSNMTMMLITKTGKTEKEAIENVKSLIDIYTEKKNK